ncbi:hypothetical protein [Nonomuraea sp. NPDC049480]
MRTAQDDRDIPKAAHDLGMQTHEVLAMLAGRVQVESTRRRHGA